MKTLVAGETLTLTCPEGARPVPQAHSVLPQEQPVFFVLESNESSLKLGPLKAGEFELKISCTKDQEIVEKVHVQALKTPPKHLESLNTLSMDFPGWIILVLLSFLFSLIAVLLYRTYKKKLRNKALKKTREPTLAEKMEKAIAKSRGKSFLEETNSNRVKADYTELVALFRLVIDKAYDMNTEFYTSSEFIATLRPLGQRKGLGPEKLSSVESMLLRSDQVRFAKYIPSPQERKLFIDDLESVYNTLRVHIVPRVQSKGVPSGNRQS